MSNGQAPVPQEHLRSLLLPAFQQRGRRYRKAREALARPAVPGEVVVSITSTGVETTNVAGDGDIVVMNLTAAREMYIVRAAKFEVLYDFVSAAADGWNRYRPLGELIGLEVGEMELRNLERDNPLEIEAPWGYPQRVELNDFLVMPPDWSEIYRIARQEFFETYVLVGGSP